MTPWNFMLPPPGAAGEPLVCTSSATTARSSPRPCGARRARSVGLDARRGAVIRQAMAARIAFGFSRQHMLDAAGPGSAHLEPKQVAESLYDILSSAGDHRASVGPHSVRIGALNRQVRALRMPHEEDIEMQPEE